MRPWFTATRITIIVAAVLVATGLGVGLGLGLGASGNNSSTSSNETQLTSIKTACQQWLGATPLASGTTQWCSELTRWMGTYMGAHGLGPEMMDPSRLNTICKDWLEKAPPSNAPQDRASWCDSMVSWMEGHITTWSGRASWGAWMQRGPMMGYRGSAP